MFSPPRHVLQAADDVAVAFRAGDAGGNDAAFPIDDFHLDVRLDAPDRRHAALQRIVVRALEADRTRLGHAAGDGHLRMCIRSTTRRNTSTGQGEPAMMPLRSVLRSNRPNSG